MNNPYRQVIQEEIEARLKARDLITDSHPFDIPSFKWVNGFITALEWVLEQDDVKVIK